ncbi:growth-regulating factor 6-like isoform X1 [Zingiber officinale]|uniref:growth-regulating factor 6-like isoform X1 n=1 Tax=Zingiber officinale TaxID=94328 RepID=UPI001C4A8A27|nr:growth-regulating factor 6-like isoform X1 [Zingiber officinale]
MDLGGVVRMAGLGGGGGGGVGASSEGGSLLSCLLTNSSTEACKPKGLLGREAFHRLGRAAETPHEHCDWRALKMARTAATVAEPHFLLPDGGQMLSFSSTSKQDSFVLKCDGSMPSYYSTPATSSPKPFLWNPGPYSGSHDVNMNGVLARVRRPFTPSQWLELEHQVLVYKYIDARVPIPPSLLTPISRSLSSSAFPHFSPGSFGSSAFCSLTFAVGWGSFYSGYAGNADPEPGRCRRTDGKKWRCSRDAVADQKYCERHMNRGRHRSRKHVEGQSGHAAEAKPAVTPSQLATAVSGGGGSSRVAQTLSRFTKSTVGEACPAPFNMMSLSKENAIEKGQDLVSLSTKPKSVTSMDITEQLNADFQPVSTCTRFNSCSSFSDNNLCPTLKLEALHPQPYSLHHFIDDWPKTQSDQSTVTWPEIEDLQSERTKLSMSIPMASSKFSSSASPNNKNVTFSPLKLSREYDLPREDSQMSMLTEVNQRKASWIPIHWEVSMGGPLGEALTNTNSKLKDQSKNSSSSLNLMNEGWDLGTQMDSSPSGVLQRTSFGSLSSSTGSSPRAENKKTNRSTGSLCDELLAHPL